MHDGSRRSASLASWVSAKECLALAFPFGGVSAFTSGRALLVETSLPLAGGAFLAWADST